MFKKSLQSSIFCILHPAWVLLSVCSLHFTPGPQSVVCSLRFTLTGFLSPQSLGVGLKLMKHFS